MEKLCIDCNKNLPIERHRCKECVLIYNRERVKKYYKKDKTRYGIVLCSECGQNLIKNRPNQTTHGSCKIQYKTVENYNKVSRNKKGNTKGRQTILDLGFELGKNLVVHHIDENPENNILSNLWVINRKHHAQLHRFLEKQWSILRGNKTENSWDLLQNQLTINWLEMTDVKLIKITDVEQSAMIIFNENCIYSFTNN